MGPTWVPEVLVHERHAQSVWQQQWPCSCLFYEVTTSDCFDCVYPYLFEFELLSMPLSFEMKSRRSLCLPIPTSANPPKNRWIFLESINKKFFHLWRLCFSCKLYQRHTFIFNLIQVFNLYKASKLLLRNC